MFTKQDYDTLHSIVFSGRYPGYKPETREIPNGDGKVDADKRYAHVATKYLAKYTGDDGLVLVRFLERAHAAAIAVAETLGVPANFMPRITECALRVLEYPSGVGGHAHTDFDLFTLSMYRSEPSRLVLANTDTTRSTQDAAREAWARNAERLMAGRRLNPGLHIGELGELIGLGEATRHHVEASDRVQHSIVYFALPSPDARLSTITAGEWLAERYARSRVGT